LAIAIYIDTLANTIHVAATTIQLTRKLKKTLESMKLHPRETYNDVLERILEDLSELNEETKREIEQAVKEIEAGKIKTHEQVKAEMGF
jgi:predicted transcriptional regulator